MSELYRISTSDNSKYEADVVFVHGLGGDAFETWRHKKPNIEGSWPYWLAEDHPNVRVWSLDYPANRTKWSRLWKRSRDTGNTPLLDMADEVLGDLALDNIGEHPILFVCHSLGGLLTKQILRNAELSKNEEKRAIFQNTRLVLFLATPHAGAKLASLASYFEKVIQPTVMVEDLKEDDSQLRDLHRWYLSSSKEAGIMTVSFCEGRDTLVGRIVTRTSCELGIDDSTLLNNEDHFSIAKLSSQEAPVYRKTCDLLADYVLAIGTGHGEIRCVENGINTSSNDIGKNPFVEGSPLGPDCRSYVRRPCDDRYEALLKTSTKISICGPFQVGKTSLMYTTERILGETWSYVGQGLADLRPDREDLFIENFFEMVKENLGHVSDWRDIRENLKERPTVFFLDDLGEIASPGCKALIPRLHTLAEELPNYVRLVTTSPEGINSVLPKRGIANPKYARNWKTVNLAPFDEDEAKRLVHILPRRPQDIVLTYWSMVKNLASFSSNQFSGIAPARLQRLCHVLYEAERQRVSEDSLVEIVNSSDTYD